MKIKKFEGSEMPEILRAIKEDLGPDAVILSTREIRKTVKRRHSGFLTLPVIEVTAAKESPEPLRKMAKDLPYPFEKALTQAVQGDIYKELQEIKSSLVSLRQSEGLSAARPSDSKRPIPATEIEAVPNMYEAWLEMKVMMKSFTEMRQGNVVCSENQTLARTFEQLLSSGVDRETAGYLVEAVKAQCSQEALWKPERVQDSLHGVIRGLVKVSGPLMGNQHTSDSPKVVVLVGPTGVGKTTTTVKLGVSRQKKRQAVTLVSLGDAEEWGSDALLQNADRHGIPALRMNSCQGLRKLVLGRKKGELILVDTAGRSHLNPADICTLKELMSIGVPLETHLVLSANTKGSDLSDMIDRFSVVPIDALLFTKIDETQSYGPILSALGRKRKPVSYFTTGRRVPEDIELATPKRFTDLFIAQAVQVHHVLKKMAVLKSHNQEKIVQK